MWDKYRESFYKNLSLETAKKYDILLNDAERVVQVDDFTFAEAAEYMRYVLIKKSLTGSMFRNYARLFDYIRHTSESVGYCCCAIVRYNAPVNEKMFGRYVKNIKSPTRRAFLYCIYDGIPITSELVQARESDYNSDRKILLNKYFLSAHTAQVIEELVRGIHPLSQNRYIFHYINPRNSLPGDYYVSHWTGVKERRRFEVKTGARLSTHSTKKRNQLTMPDGRLVYYYR